MSFSPFLDLAPVTRKEGEAIANAIGVAIHQFEENLSVSRAPAMREALQERLSILYSLRTMYAEAIMNHRDVSSVYLWANGMIMTFDLAGDQIGELQGPNTDVLVAAIRDRATIDTTWHGFPPDEPMQWLDEATMETHEQPPPGWRNE